MNATTSAPPSKLAARLAALQALAQSASSPEQFFTGWLEHVLAALCGATGGRLRRPSADGSLASVALAAVRGGGNSGGGRRRATNGSCSNRLQPDVRRPYPLASN